MTDVLAVLDRLEAKMDKIIAQTGPRRPSGDEKIFKEPREKDYKSGEYQGESYAGSSMSECPPYYLRALAKYKNACAYANRKEGDASKIKYADSDEATARLAIQWAEFFEMSGPVSAPVTRSIVPRDERERVIDAADDPIPF